MPKAPTPPEIRRTVAEKAAKLLEVPADVITNMAHLELAGNREVNIDGCKGILEYDENIVRINAGSMIIKFSGRGLTLRNLTQDSAVLEGFITSIEFSS